MKIYPCASCAAKRKQLRDHLKKLELVKAAKVAAEGAKLIVKGKPSGE